MLDSTISTMQEVTLQLGMPTLIHLVLKYIQVVCGSYSNDVLLGVPGRVQDLLVEVQAVDADLVLLPLAAGAHLARLQHRARFVVLPGRLQGDVSLCVSVKHPEEVVVRPCHDNAAQRGKEGRCQLAMPSPLSKPEGLS